MAELVPDPPSLTEAQRLWLLELGLDRPMLARFARRNPPLEGGAGPAAAGAEVASDVHAGSVQGGPAQAEAGAAAPDSAAGAQTQSGAGRDERSRALAALAALRQGGGPSAPAPETVRPAPVPSSPGAVAIPAGGSSDWHTLEAAIQTCEACGLHAGRQAAVPGAGATESVDWLVVGEAPGGRDDGLGQPFQGKAGDLLHAMLAAAGIEPAQRVFYTNLVKCRPRSNRPPTPEEIAACLPHLRRQAELLQPRGILALGRLAAQALLGEAASFEHYRGRVHAFQSGGRDIPVVVTYHPASLLSRPRHKAAGWRDLNLARTVC